MQDNPFWQYSLAVYNDGDFSSLLLRCQDEFDADVNMLLCCCWLGHNSTLLEAKQLASLDTAIAQWRSDCVKSIRGVRQFLKEQEGYEHFRAEVKALELLAEQQQQRLMYQHIKTLALSANQRDCAIKNNLQNYVHQLPGYDTGKYSNVLTQVVDAAIIASSKTV